jgi:hypothetical protein
MQRRVLPFSKPGGRTVRFSVEECDLALDTYQYRSIFDGNIQQELARRRALHGNPLQIESELGSPPA